MQEYAKLITTFWVGLKAGAEFIWDMVVTPVNKKK
jgi:hypothetical protein